MGVKGLWKLLLPIGRRISIETLHGKRLAVDASIWLTQFLKAMRNPDTGKVQAAAHLVGLFRRLCRLKYHGIRAVLVFDGATPEIKKRETAARRRRREQFRSDSDVAIQRLAKRLLVENLKKQKTEAKSNASRGIRHDRAAFAPGFNPSEETSVETVPNVQNGKGVQVKAEATQPKPPKAVDIMENYDFEETDSAPRVSDWDLPLEEENQDADDHSKREDDDTSSSDDENVEYEDFGGRDDRWKQFGRSRKRRKMGVRVDDIALLPPSERKEAIEQAKREQRLQSRKEFMPAAADPLQFSQVQISNFLRSTRLNQSIVRMATHAAQRDNVGMRGEAMASDNGTRVELIREAQHRAEEPTNFSKKETLPKRKKVQLIKHVSRDESSDEEWEQRPVGSRNRFDDDDSSAMSDKIPRRKTIAQLFPSGSDDDDNDSESNLAAETAVVRQNVDNPSQQVSPGPTAAEKAEVLNETSSDDDDHVGWEDGSDTEPETADVQLKEPSFQSDPSLTEPQQKERPQDQHFKNETIKVPSDQEQVNQPNSVPTEKQEQDDIEVVSDQESIQPEKGDFCSPDVLADDGKTAKALQQAQSTASNLANWAGRAFRRAMNEANLGPSSPTRPNLSSSSGAADADSPFVKPPPVSGQEVVTETVPGPIEVGNLDEDDIRREIEQWQRDHNKRERDYDTVTDDMRHEAMQLLQLFGVPYLVAPAEAEAQCATLEKLGLVDGIVTEDSDAFIFGGRTIYKNIFDEMKYTEAYISDDAEREMSLGHNEMVALAMLLGGDYTEGVKGVGIVNAMEVLEAFPVKDGLKQGLSEFRKWLDGFDLSEEVNSMSAPVRDFDAKHKSAKGRWSVPDSFPCSRVISAYVSPVVDTSRQEFSWGEPDSEGLVTFSAKNMGWTKEETLKYLDPILHKMGDGYRQTRIDSFMKYEDSITFAKVQSKRLQKVLQDKSGA